MRAVLEVLIYEVKQWPVRHSWLLLITGPDANRGRCEQGRISAAVYPGSPGRWTWLPSGCLDMSWSIQARVTAGNLTIQHRPHATDTSPRPAPTTGIDLRATSSHRGDHRSGHVVAGR
jgi:hypothetical protein